jgi:hypothetical protein
LPFDRLRANGRCCIAGYSILKNALAYAPGQKPVPVYVPHSFGVTIILDVRGQTFVSSFLRSRSMRGEQYDPGAASRIAQNMVVGVLMLN